MLSENLSGQILDDRYQLLEKLGAGGMGSVYKAVQLDLGRTVAIKVLLADSLLDPDSRKRFLREGKSLAALKHPKIIAFYHFGIWKDKRPYIAMEYVEGEDLRKIINRESKLSWQRALQITIEVAEAMQYVHEQGILNRDLKAQNIMLKKEEGGESVKIIDFGLAKFNKEDEGLTQTGSLLGSVQYMSPEQCKGLSCTAASDIYSLGCVLYEALSGRPPFEAENAIAILNMHVNKYAARLLQDSGNQAFPQGLENCVFKALAKNPQDRYASMSDFAKDLQLIQSGNWQDLSAQTGVIELAGKFVKRRSIWQPKTALLLLGLLAVFTGVFFLLSDPGYTLLQIAELEAKPGIGTIDSLINNSKKQSSEKRYIAASLLAESAKKMLRTLHLNAAEESLYLSKISEVFYLSKQEEVAGQCAIESLNLTLALADSNPNLVFRESAAPVELSCKVLSQLSSRIAAANYKTLRTLSTRLNAIRSFSPKARLELLQVLTNIRRRTMATRTTIMSDEIATGTAYLELENYKQAIPELENAWQLLKENRPSETGFRSQLIPLLLKAYAQAKEAEKLKDLVSKLESDKHIPFEEIIAAQRNLGSLYFQKRQYENSARHYNEVIDSAVKSGKPELIEYNDIVYFGFSMRADQKFKEISSRLEEFLSLWKAKEYPHNLIYLGFIREQALSLSLSAPMSARKFAEATLITEEKSKSPNEEVIFACLNSLADIELRSHNYKLAKLGANKLIAAAYKDQTLLYPQALFIGTQLKSRALLAESRKAEAFKNYEECLNQAAKLSDPYSKGYAFVLSDACIFFSAEGQSEKAIQTLIQNIQRWHSLKIQRTYGYAVLVRSLYQVYMHQSRIEDAEQMLKKVSTEVLDSKNDQSPIPRVLCHILLRQLYLETRREKEAEAESVELEKLQNAYFNAPDIFRQAKEIAGHK
ncbi:MAG: serine/threonine protein kinase [Candidatus Obscuribacterales bacterium]|nr:serine/threonine protein kinase [Candidatus Obscuribacterales bacterium]